MLFQNRIRSGWGLYSMAAETTFGNWITILESEESFLIDTFRAYDPSTSCSNLEGHGLLIVPPVSHYWIDKLARLLDFLRTSWPPAIYQANEMGFNSQKYCARLYLVYEDEKNHTTMGICETLFYGFNAAPGNVTRNTKNWLSTSRPASNGFPREIPWILMKSLSD